MSLKLTGLSLDSYKRITLAKIEFDPDRGGVVALMGENEAGKSSALDGLEALIAGRKAPKQAMPVHKGADRAVVIATFREDDGTDLVVTRTYKAGGATTIDVRQDGMKVARPDEILSKLYSHVALDPLAFAQLGSKEQTETLLGLIGFDPSALDREAANVFATRTEVGQRVKALTGQLAGYPAENIALADQPLVDIAAVNDELEAAREHNALREALNQEAVQANRAIVSMDTVIEDLEARLSQAKARRADLVEQEATAIAERDATAELPLSGFLEQIRTADETNRQIRESQARAKVAADLAAAEAERQSLTDRLEAIAAEKRAGFESADMPIPGLTIEDGEVYLDGTPFSQTSAGGKLRTSTAIAMALNPDLRAIIIRDGSLLDAKNRGIIDSLAAANDFTVLMEIVDESAATGVVFSDGKIAEVRA